MIERQNYKKSFCYLIINDSKLNMKNAINVFAKITSILTTTLMGAQISSFLKRSWNHKPKFNKKSV
jgi:hypothetical protein